MSQSRIDWKDIVPSDQMAKFIDDLPEGKCAITFAKPVTDPVHDKLQVEFAEKVVIAGRGMNIVSFFNKGDQRFTQGARRNWTNMTPKMAKELYGIEVPDTATHLEVMQMNPQVNGMDLHIQVFECVLGDLPARYADTPEYYEKRGRTDDEGNPGQQFFTKGGEPIYQYTELCVANSAAEVQHVLLEGQMGVPVQAPLGTAQPAVNDEVKGIIGG